MTIAEEKTEVRDESKDVTTVALSKGTKDRLDKFGDKGDKYEDIILRLVNFYESVKKM